MDMIGRIRRLHTRDKKSVRAIARITGLSRNTVTKWLSEPVDTPPKYQRAEHAGKLTAFHETLRMALKADARRPKHERRTAKARSMPRFRARATKAVTRRCPTLFGRGAKPRDSLPV